MDVTGKHLAPAAEQTGKRRFPEEAVGAEGETAAPDAPAVTRTPSASVMPDFTWPRYGFYHTLDSTLASLSCCGIAPERITITKAGPGWQRDRVVRQEPATGSPLTDIVAIELAVEGEGLFYHLPTGMRQLGPYPEQEPGIPELAALFDDQVEKAAYYVRHGGRYFDVRPENLPGCARWIRLFGIDPEDWPSESLYTLAVLLAHVHVLAGREAGLQLALRLLLGLEIVTLRWRQRCIPLCLEDLSRLGERASRLDVDFILGKELADEATLEMTLGPVSLPLYRQHQTAEGQRRIRQVLHLVLPYHLEYAVRWLVGNTSRAPRLGIDQENAVLGINSHLGRG